MPRRCAVELDRSPPPRALVQADSLPMSPLCWIPGSSCCEKLPTRGVGPAIAALPSEQKPGLAGRACGSRKEQSGGLEGETEGSKWLLRAESQGLARVHWAERPWEWGERGLGGAESKHMLLVLEPSRRVWGKRGALGSVGASVGVSLCPLSLLTLVRNQIPGSLPDPSPLGLQHAHSVSPSQMHPAWSRCSACQGA